MGSLFLVPRSTTKPKNRSRYTAGQGYVTYDLQHRVARVGNKKCSRYDFQEKAGATVSE